MRTLPVSVIGGMILAVAALLDGPGCSRPDASRDASAAKPEHRLSASDEQYITGHFAGAIPQASGLRWLVRAPGTGTATPRFGQEVIAHYEGRLLDGTPFDSSYRQGQPFVFRVGTGAVIKGWDEAFLTMTKGEKRTLIIPYWLAYGDRGSPPRIPGRATLVFEVELLDWR